MICEMERPKSQAFRNRSDYGQQESKTCQKNDGGLELPGKQDGSDRENDKLEAQEQYDVERIPVCKMAEFVEQAHCQCGDNHGATAPLAHTLR